MMFCNEKGENDGWNDMCDSDCWRSADSNGRNRRKFDLCSCNQPGSIQQSIYMPAREVITMTRASNILFFDIGLIVVGISILSLSCYFAFSYKKKAG